MAAGARMTGRSLSLDGLRGVAALMVFAHHAQLPGFGQAGKGLDAGVMLFFALSGYLLYRPLVDRQGDLVAYAARRALRIMPAYLVAAVGVAVIWQPSFLADPVGIATMRGPIVVTWTLAIEVCFYVALPLIALALRHVRRPELWIAWGALASLGVGALELALTRTSPLGFPAWAWAFAPGMLVALPSISARLARVPTVAPAVALVAVSVVFDLGYPDIPGALGAGLLVAALLKRPTFGGRASVALGAVSYSIYLWHVPIIDALDRPASLAGAAIALIVTLAIAGTCFLLVERPAVELGKRIHRGRQPLRPGLVDEDGGRSRRAVPPGRPGPETSPA